MRFSRSFYLMGLFVLALSACSSNSADNIGSVDDIVIENRGIPSAAKAEKDAVTTLKATADAEIVEVTDNAADLDKAADIMADAPKVDVAEKVTEIMTQEVVSKALKHTVADSNTPKVASAQREGTVSLADKKMELMKPTPMLSDAPEDVAEKEPMPAPSGSSELPPNAKPGECYAKVLIPAKTRAKSERVQVSEEQKVLVRIIPAQYKIETEQVLVKEARTYWKPGTGPHQRVDETTGKIMCLVEEPAEYKTIEKRVLVSPEQPEHKTMPAQFETVTRMEIVEDERLEWRRILCDTNVTPAVIMQIQRALIEKGYDAGPVDGRVGQKTLRAINQFQVDNNLASRGMTYEMIDSLGVKLAGM